MGGWVDAGDAARLVCARTFSSARDSCARYTWSPARELMVLVTAALGFLAHALVGDGLQNQFLGGGRVRVFVAPARWHTLEPSGWPMVGCRRRRVP